MFSRKKEVKTVIRVTDTQLSYLSLARNAAGFFIDQHETVALPEGIIKRGEILKADVFSKILKKIAQKIENKKIDILLEHEYFLYKDAVLPADAKTTDIKKRVKNYFSSLGKKDSWHTNHICEFQTFQVGRQHTVLFTCLPKDVQKSYLHVFKKSGLRVSSINSDVLAFDHLLQSTHVTMVKIGHEHSYIIDLKKGMYSGQKKFQVSYQQFIEDIVRHVTITKDKAQSILMRYGILRTHKDEQVYKRLLRSASPLFSFLKKRKNPESMHMYVMYDNYLVPGFADAVSQYAGIPVHDFDIFALAQYSFHDILTLHRNETYTYQPHIAQALRSFEVKK